MTKEQTQKYRCANLFLLKSMEAFLNQSQQSNGGHEIYSTGEGKSLFVQTRGQCHFCTLSLYR